MAQTIYIIEDEADLSDALEVKLKDEGYTVFTEASAEIALLKIKEVMPDLVLLDLFTYSVHGIHFLERLRSDLSTQNIKCIILTNIDHEGQRKKAHELGAIDYLIKSETSLSKVVEAVKKALEQ